ncbi:GmrSD restriction endonuclease domain-containing protein [Vibrio navarrensis]|uniref:GmrSD restriction endonuclease domain-containing protein n=1 Tax=Vibrio navarrensis TaxID=29495 RepID=UPI001869C55C|nr:DUF262 domain-containing protein [Vibrio navarrensis]MBE4617298.1 hypothetical protein [Vibrio navarrensis]
MHLVGAKLKNFYDFTNKNEGDNSLKPYEVQVKIPHYQRPYEWEKEHVSLLINDTLNNNNGKYFSGASVSSIHDEYCHELVDGQQRYTTLFLLNYCVFLVSRVALREALLSGAYVHANSLAEKLEKSFRYIFILKNDHAFNEKEANKLQKEIDKEMLLDEPDYEKVQNLKTKIKTLKNQDNTDKELFIKSVFDRKYHELINDIKEKGNTKTRTEYDKALDKLNSLGVLTKLSQSDENYHNENKKLLECFFDNAEFRITYARKKYADLLKTSLLSLDFTLSSQSLLSIVDLDQKLESTYKDAINVIFDEITSRISDNNPLEHAIQVINTLLRILESLDICVVQTGNQSDATILFDVLNDRSKELSQLSLIKNEFYKRVVIYYEKNNNFSDSILDEHIDDVDELWVGEIFNASISDAALVSYLGACFLSGSTNTNYSTNGKETRKAISDYLASRDIYSVEDLKFDICVFRAIKTILNKVGVKYQKVLDISLTAEAESKSIFERVVKLLIAKKQEGILAGVINSILWKYFSLYGTGQKINIENLKSMLDKIMDSSYSDVNEQCLEVWVTSLSSKDYTLPRNLSKQLISAYNKANLNGSSIIYLSTFMRSPHARQELVSWLNEWKYRSSNQFEVKVLLINLMSRDPAKGIKLIDKPQFFSGFIDAASCHLDHFEPKSLPSSNPSEYFQSASRDDFVNSLGNMMLLTQVDNQRKSDSPAAVADDYYASSDISNNWLYRMLHQKYITHSKNKVPTELFFTERKKELINQIAELLHN